MRRIMERARRRLRPASMTGDDVAAVSRSTSEDEQAILDAVREHTMTTVERQLALIDAVTYVEQAGVDGAFVECGVWRGGSVLAMLLRLRQLGDATRDVYLYDTFTGMTRPTEADTSDFHPPALESWDEEVGGSYEGLFGGADSSLQAVKDLLATSGHPAERVHYAVGPVEDTLPGVLPDRIALLRLDTDWYESTRHELEHLYPRVVPGGVVIIDDYGHWKGCRKAVDEYLAVEGRTRPLMHRVDYTCRMWVKPHGEQP